MTARGRSAPAAAAPVRPGDRPAAWIAVAAGLLAATILFYWPITIGGGIPTDYDRLVYFYPYQEHLGAALRAGQLPLWNPYLFGGVPFAANIQTAVFYPPNWVAAGLPPPAATIVLTVGHVWLAALGLAAYVRIALLPRWPGAVAAGLTYAWGGFLTHQAAHPNQLATAAWLPWLLLAATLARRPGGAVWLAPGCLIVAAMILAGHSQEAYYSLVLVAVEALAAGVWAARARRSAGGDRRAVAIDLLRPAAVVGGLAAAGAALAAVQLVPTLELARQGIRSGGLSLDDAIAFSLPPWLLHRGLLPFGTGDLPTLEYVGYLGLIAWGLAGVGLFWGRSSRRWLFGGIAAAGLLLALGGYEPLYGLIYRIVPGVGLFRVPARWLLWVAFGAAVLVAYGLDRLTGGPPPAPGTPQSWGAGRGSRRRLQAGLGLGTAAIGLALLAPSGDVRIGWIGLVALGGLALLLGPPARARRPLVAVAVVLLAAELWLAGRPLTGLDVTHPQAWFSVRPAIATLIAEPGQDRAISVAASTFEPGDRFALREIYGDRLGRSGLTALFVALKLREIGSPNLPLAIPRATLDGYDGGLLPLRAYVAFKSALIEAAAGPPESRVGAIDRQPDGLLIRQLPAVPPTDLLSALNVGHVIADKALDPWLDGVYYDRGLTERIAPGRVWTRDRLPDFAATRVGLVSYLEGGPEPAPGTVVGTLHLTSRDGTTVARPIRAGVETAGGLRAEPAPPAGPRVAATWPGTDRGFDYLATFDLDPPGPIDRLAIAHAGPGRLVVRGLSLIDGRTGASESVPLRPEFRLVQSGDLKVYRNESVLPRAYLIDAAADPRGRIADLPDVMARPLAGSSPDLGTVTPAESAPGDVSFDVSARQPARLIFTETAYPGWEAAIDGRPAATQPAAGIFQSVEVPAGASRVTFRFNPASWKIGAAISGVAAIVLLVAALIAIARRRAGRVSE